jgi:8-oxo-dGTP diphosphatase
MLLVRHGHAGTKEKWDGDDDLRPLDARGLRQAKHIVDVVVPLGPNRIVSSPFLRCLQTMEPLASKTGLVVDEDGGLTPNAGQVAVDLVRSLSSSASANRIVLCTHGEVIGEVLSLLATEDGVRLGRRAPGLKGCVWDLDFRKGRASSARYIAPGR